MKQNIKNTGERLNRLFAQAAAQKKKSVMAVCLIALMVFMWVRVLKNKAPQTAGAAVVTQKATEGRSDSAGKISFVELPVITGRNDVLTRDFFVVDNWQSFLAGQNGKNSGDIGDVNVLAGDGTGKTLKQVAEKLQLEVIELGRNPHAFINGKLLSVGDKFDVKDGINTYECEVIGIEENTVFIRTGEAKISLRLAKAGGAAN